MDPSPYITAALQLLVITYPDVISVSSAAARKEYLSGAGNNTQGAILQVEKSQYAAKQMCSTHLVWNNYHCEDMSP